MKRMPRFTALGLPDRADVAMWIAGQRYTPIRGPTASRATSQHPATTNNSYTQEDIMGKFKTIACTALAIASLSTGAVAAAAMGITPAQAAEPTGLGDIQVEPYRPVPTMFEPEPADSYHTARDAAPVPFLGTAIDPQDGAVPGTRLRWTATAGSKSVVMCQGSSWPGTGNPDSLGVYRDCTWGVASLPALLPGQSWTVQLCAADKHSNIGCTSRKVPIEHIVI